MEQVRRLIAGLLKFVALSVLFVGSCVGPGLMYWGSPWLFLKSVDLGYDGAFYVAFRLEGGEVPKQVQVMRYEIVSEGKKYSDVQFHLPNGRLNGRGPGKADAMIDVTTEKESSQLIKVFVIGDSPWTALSEYRVVDNKVYPLRHADSVKWLLLGVVICPFLIFPLARPIRRSINRFMRIDPE